VGHIFDLQSQLPLHHCGNSSSTTACETSWLVSISETITQATKSKEKLKEHLAKLESYKAAYHDKTFCEVCCEFVGLFKVAISSLAQRLSEEMR